MLVPPGKEGLTAADILSLYQGSGLRAVTAPSHEGHHGSHP
jgi:hypothetical protein